MDQRKIRVLYITDTFRQRSGITAVIRNYLTHFDWDKIQVDLLVNDTSEKEAVEQMRKLGANIFYMPVLGMRTISPFFKFIKSFFKEHHYDIVHSHYYQIDTLVFPIAKKHFNCKCISHSHSTKYSEYFIRGLRNRIMCWNIGKVADYWAACSNDAGIFLFGKSFQNSPKKLIVINGIESKEYLFDNLVREQKRKEFGIGNEEIIVGHIGRMAPPKNPLFLLDIFQELLKINDKYRLMMVGNGPMESEVRDKATRLGLNDKIYFAGVRNDVPKLINAFDFFLFPSLYEGLGIVAVEAQANGLNCLVSDVIPSEVDLTGITRLSLKKPASEWAQTINEIGTNRHENNVQKVVEAGYDIQIAANALYDFYSQIIIISQG